jgi:hypothetical protein
MLCLIIIKIIGFSNLLVWSDNHLLSLLIFEAFVTTKYLTCYTHVGFHVCCSLFLPNFNQNWNVLANFKFPSIRVYQNPFCICPVVLCVQLDRQNNFNRPSVRL